MKLIMKFSFVATYLYQTHNFIPGSIWKLGKWDERI